MRRRGTLLIAALFASACSTHAAAVAPSAATVPPANPPDAAADEEFPRAEDLLSPAGRLALALIEDRAIDERFTGEGPDPFVASSVLRREAHVREALGRLLEVRDDGLTRFFVALADPAATDGQFDGAIAAIVAAGGDADGPPGAAAPFVSFVLEHVGRIDDAVFEEEFVGRAVRALRADPNGRAAYRDLLDQTVMPRARLVGLCLARSEDPAAFRRATGEIAAIAAGDPPPGTDVAHVAWTGAAAPRRLDLRLTAAGELAFGVMDRADAFRGPVGGEGALTVEGLAMTVLLAEREADAAFKCLAQGESPARRLYAACGLRHTDAAAAARLAGELKAQRGVIRTQFGCIVAGAPIATIADEIASGGCDTMFVRR